jgi:hypothetical protein
VTLPPWEYLFLSFNSANFHDLFWPVVIASIVLLVVLIGMYWIRTRQLRHHPPYLELYEWLLWAGLITFGWLVLCGLFVFDFIFVVVGVVGGLAVLAWIRFVRFPPMLEAYEKLLAKQRYHETRRYSRPDSTIRTKPSRRRRRR